LGTMGPVIQILDRLPEHFLVMNGDVLTDLDYGSLLGTHMASTDPITVATYSREVDVDFGVLEIEAGHGVAFREKPKFPYSVSMGVYARSRGALAGYRAGESFGFDDLMNDLIGRGQLPASFPFEGYW